MRTLIEREVLVKQSAALFANADRFGVWHVFELRTSARPGAPGFYYAKVYGMGDDAWRAAVEELRQDCAQALDVSLSNIPTLAEVSA